MLLKKALNYFFSLFKHILPFSIALWISMSPALGQQTTNDSIYSEEEDLFALPEDTMSFSQDFVPEDIIFIPSDVLYNNSWDNVNVRQKREDLSQMDDTIDIILNHPSETPFIFPRPGRFLSPFGYRGRHFHAGVDIKLNLGDTVVAAWDGKVRLAKKYRGYGNIVVIRHFNGLETVYSHLSKLLVSVNQDVKAGEAIGLGGRTGRATTTHLHFETRFLSEPFDPATFINFDNFTIKSDTLKITSALFERGSKNKKGGKNAKSSNSVKEADSEVAQYYIIRKGDTLAKIARNYNTSVKMLCKLNKLTTRSVLKPGKRLKLN